MRAATTATTHGMRKSPADLPETPGFHVATAKADNTEIVDLAAMSAWLRRMHPRETARHVEAATGIPSGTVASWLELRARPSWPRAMQLACVYGPSFLEAALTAPPTWLREATRAAEITQLRQDSARIASRLKRLTDGEGACDGSG
jgi:crotonobetainyl-CoA:carnitine CoA-transferase CaiB-like acyl-CoA transferase